MLTEVGLHSNRLDALSVLSGDCFEIIGLFALALTLKGFRYLLPVILLAWVLTLIDLVDRTFYRAL